MKWMPSCGEHVPMVNAPVSFRRFRFAPIALVVAAAFAPAVLAQEADRDLYAAARALEQTARVSLDDTAAQAERSLDDVHTAVAAYLLVPRRYPASSFSDDARRFVVQVVLFELDSVGTGGFFLRRDGFVVRRLALLAEEAGQPRALLLGDVRTVDPHEARRRRRQEQHVAAPEELLGAVAVEDGARVDLRLHAE